MTLTMAPRVLRWVGTASPRSRNRRYWPSMLVKRAAVTGALRAMGKYEAYGGMFLLPWSDRSCAPLCRELAKKLPETAREAVRQMEKLFPALDTGAPFDPRLKLTFGGVELD